MIMQHEEAGLGCIWHEVAAVVCRFHGHAQSCSGTGKSRWQGRARSALSWSLGGSCMPHNGQG